MASLIHSFGELELDEALYELRRRGEVVRVEPRVFNALTVLIRQRERVVSKEELRQELWPGTHVSDASLASCIRDLRRAVGDDGAGQSIVKTIHGRGYRFVAQVTSRSATPVQASLPPATRAPAWPSRPPFVGRQREMEILTACLESALAGRGRVALLAGDAGIGKTRIAEEVGESGRRRGMQVLIGRCHEGEGAPAFWPWVQVIRSCLRGCDEAALATVLGSQAGDIAPLVPEIKERLANLATPPALEPERARFRLFDATATFLQRAAAARPLLVILDDLHWADEASLRLLTFIAAELTEAPVLLIGNYRENAHGPEHPLKRALGELARLQICRRILLSGLNVEEVASLLAAVAGSAGPSSLVSDLHRDTEGNPFFLNEILLLLPSGPLPQRLEATFRVPPTVREAIDRHLRGLSEPCRRALQMAAIFGREIDLPLLKRAWMAEHGRAAQLLAALDEAAKARVVEATHARTQIAPHLHRYRFLHVLIRDTLYEEIGSANRARLHRRAARAIEALHQDDLEAHLTVLAHHLVQAVALDGPRRAIDYTLRAAAWASRQLAHETAAAHYASALALLEANGCGAERRGELLLALGTEHWRAGDMTQARAVFREAARIARRLRLPRQLARAALGFGDALRGFEAGVVEPDLIALLEEALRELGGGEDALRARLLGRLAVALYYAPDAVLRREQLSREAVTTADRAGDIATRLMALYSHHWAVWGPDSLQERLQTAAEMVRLAEQAGDAEMLFHAHRFRFMDLLECGARDAMERELSACAVLANELRQPYYLWYVRSFHALRAFLDGSFADSERLAQEAAVIGQRAQNQNVLQIFAMQIFALRREQGRLAEVEAPARVFIAQYPHLPAWRAALALTYCELGRAAEARGQIEALAAGGFASIPRDTFWMAAIAALGQACAAIGEERHAATLYTLLRPHADRNVVMTPGTACMGSAAFALGRIAAALGHWADAEGHFTAALQVQARLGARHFVAHTQCAYAEMLLARGAASDRARAAEMLDDALACYVALDMEAARQRATAQIQRLQDIGTVRRLQRVSKHSPGM